MGFSFIKCHVAFFQGHHYDRCGQMSTVLNNPWMAWKKESQSHGSRQLERRSPIGELPWLRTCLSAELLESSTASKSHFEGKNTCTLLHCSVGTLTRTTGLGQEVHKFIAVEIERHSFTWHARTLKVQNEEHK